MSDQALRRADELLSELVELVETARALPMSSSCVVPREAMLDLLDALREVMPPEMAQARSIVAHRESVEADAAAAAAEVLAQARAEADRVVHAARVEAHEVSESARAEADRLVSSSSIHQTAVSDAATVRAEADAFAAATRAEAGSYAEGLRRSGERYADQTLSDLVDLLSQAARTAENGRRALTERAAGSLDAEAAGETEHHPEPDAASGAPDPDSEGREAGDPDSA